MDRPLFRASSTARAFVLACTAVLALAASASAAEEPVPSITKPADATSVTGKAAVVTVTGSNLATLTATGLPAGINSEPVKVSATEWKLEGTPTTAETATVTLEAKNEEGTAGTPVKFKWSVKAPEAAPSVTKPSDQAGVTGKAASVTITGTGLATLTATGLPAGVGAPVKVSATEWKLQGTPTTAETATVTLEAKNEEGTAGSPVKFKWVVSKPEAAPTIAKPADQSGATGAAVTLTITGTGLAALTATGLPAGVGAPVKVSATEWKLQGTPTTAETATVTLEAKNTEGAAGTPVQFKWVVSAPSEAPKEVTPPPPTTTTPIPSAGRLGTVPVQKLGRELFASFLCEVASCKVQVTATITAGKSKFKVRSAQVTIAQGKKTRIPMRLDKKQRGLISAALKKHKKVLAALNASIDSSVGMQVTKALTVTVKR